MFRLRGRVAGALDQVSIEIRRSWPQFGAALGPWRLFISSGVCLRLLLSCGSSLLERPSHPAGSSKQQWAILILLKRHQDGTQGQCELKEG